MVDAEFYRSVWLGYVTEYETIERLLSRAVDVINGAIFLTGFTVETVPERLQTAVYKAVCAQADYIDSAGGVEAMSESDNMTSVSLGRFSYSGGGAERAGGSGSAVSLCEQARLLLLPTGLLYRGGRAV